MMIKAVLFDMDGVLFDSERAGQIIFEQMTSALGYSEGKERFLSLLGTNMDRDRVICREYWGNTFPFDDIMGTLYSKREALAREGKIPLKPGVPECLSYLKAKEIPAAIVSGSNAELIQAYLNMIPGMSSYFRIIVSGDCGIPSKPDPAPYLKAAEMLNLPPAQCLGVEDSLNGVMALRSAGVVSVCIPDLIPWSSAFMPYVDYRLPDMTVLPSLITRLNKGGILRA